MQGSRTELRECPQMVQLYPNPWCSHLQTNRLSAEEAGFLVGVHDGASWHSVCGVHQGWPLGQGGPVASTRKGGRDGRQLCLKVGVSCGEPAAQETNAGEWTSFHKTATLEPTLNPEASRAKGCFT